MHIHDIYNRINKESVVEKQSYLKNIVTFLPHNPAGSQTRRTNPRCLWSIFVHRIEVWSKTGGSSQQQLIIVHSFVWSKSLGVMKYSQQCRVTLLLRSQQQTSLKGFSSLDFGHIIGGAVHKVASNTLWLQKDCLFLCGRRLHTYTHSLFAF